MVGGKKKKKKKAFGLGMKEKEKWVIKVAHTRAIYTQCKEIWSGVVAKLVFPNV